MLLFDCDSRAAVDSWMFLLLLAKNSGWIIYVSRWRGRQQWQLPKMAKYYQCGSSRGRILWAVVRAVVRVAAPVACRPSGRCHSLQGSSFMAAIDGVATAFMPLAFVGVPANRLRHYYTMIHVLIVLLLASPPTRNGSTILWYMFSFMFNSWYSALLLAYPPTAAKMVFCNMLWI